MPTATMSASLMPATLRVSAADGDRRDALVGQRRLGSGEPASVAFCHELGLDYVSCSPFRVPLARLAAAQAVLAAQGSLYVAAGG